MPELPDVEVNRRYLDSTALYRRIASVHVAAPEVLDGVTAQGLGRRLHDRCFAATSRHGKYLFACLDKGDALVFHFGMTGYLKFFRSASKRPEYTVCEIDFDDGSALCYVAPRKLGLIGVTPGVDTFIEAHELGDDALSLDFETFRELAAGRRGSVKSWLTNQAVIAGIGNIYADEMLFAAGIHPKCEVRELSKKQIRKLYDAMHDVLNRAIQAGADPERMPDDFLLPDRDEDGRCPRCGETLERLEISGRSTWYCPACQPSC